MRVNECYGDVCSEPRAVVLHFAYYNLRRVHSSLTVTARDGSGLNRTPKDLIRIAVGLGFNRGKMKDAYSILSGRDFTNKKVSAKLRAEQFETFKEAQAQALDHSTWYEFLKIILGLGYKSGELISSSNNIANAYILFLIAKIKVGLSRKELERYIGKWFFFSSTHCEMLSLPV